MHSPLLEPAPEPIVVAQVQVVAPESAIAPFADNDLRRRAPLIIADVEAFVKLGIGRFNREFAPMYQKAAPLLMVGGMNPSPTIMQILKRSS